MFKVKLLLIETLKWEPEIVVVVTQLSQQRIAKSKHCK